MSGSLNAELTRLLSDASRDGGFPSTLICTDGGLVVAADGDGVDPDQLAALVSLFDEIVVRARRDLALLGVDEVTLFDVDAGRFVIRPINHAGETRFFLVVRVPKNGSWRALTNRLRRQLAEILAPLAGEVAA